MPHSIGSHDSHPSIPESLRSLSDRTSISTAASTHSPSSSHSTYHPPPDTQLLSYSHTNKMPFSDRRYTNIAPQRSTTIKALRQANTSYGAAASGSPSRSSNRAGTMAEPIIVTTSDVSLASTSSPPLLDPLVFSSSGGDNVEGARARKHAYLALDEAQPRLSMSSNGSCSSNELATPEHLHQSWPYDSRDSSTLTALQASSTPLSSQAFTQEYDRFHSGSTQTIRFENREPESEIRPPSRQVDATSAQLDRLVLQRPAKLERLSSAATNATAKASTFSDESSPQTATQSPRHLQAPDPSSFRISSDLQSIPTSARAAQFSRSPSPDADLPNRASMTSPDSWRSLLPEHDPYFAAEGQLGASQYQHSASPQNLHRSPSAFDIEAYVAAKTSCRAPAHDRMSTSSLDTARTSFSSAISGFSTMSMAGLSKSSMQSQDSARSDSWRSLLPDDDRFHASRESKAINGQRSANLSPYLASPSLSDRLDSPTSLDCHNPRSAFFVLDAPRSNIPVATSDPDSAARRHSSFSSVEPNNSKQFAATRVMLTSMRDTAGSFGSIKSASEKFDAAVLPCASSPASSSYVVSAEPTHVQDALESSNMTPELSHSSAAEDDSSERDSWPTSRSGRHGSRHGADSPVSSGPLTPETGPTANPKSSLTSALAQAAEDPERVDSPLHVSETSDSVVEATQDGLLATTTTTTTKTTTTTRTQLLSGSAVPHATIKARSEAGAEEEVDCIEYGDDDGGDKLQSQPMKARTSSCSISTPISPPSLPFLERRPAPPETDLMIETERTRYVLVTRLPGFSLDCITLATKQHAHHRTLHIVADKWDTESGGHFERRITFPDKECDLINVKAEFDGNVLRVYVPRKVAANRFSSASSATF